MVDGWSLIENEKKNFFLEKNFKFKNFLDRKFVNVYGLAEDEHTLILFLDGI